MVALPISPQSLYNVSRFAHEIWQSCRTGRNQNENIAGEVFALKTAVELVALELEDKAFPVNHLDEDGTTRTHYRQLGIHLGNCQQALQATHDYVRKYEKVTPWQQLRWGRSGKEDVDGLIADLVSFTTQLDSFVGALNMKEIGRTLGRIGRLEQSLDQTEENEAAAVEMIMMDLQTTRKSNFDLERYKAVLIAYAQEACKAFNASQDLGKKTKSSSSQERKKSDATLAATSPQLQQRSHSADTILSTASTAIERSQSANPSGKKNSSNNSSNNISTNDTKKSKSHDTKPHPTLECWLIQIKTGNFTFLAWQKSGKEPQPRGQPQLRSMARRFCAAQASTKTPDEYDLVGWVVDDRQKSEPDPATHIWRPYAAKLERKEHSHHLLSPGVEEQAMVIVSRELTPTAQHAASASHRALLAEQDLARKHAKATSASLKKQAKSELAALRASEAALSRAEKTEREKAKRRAEVSHLKQQVAMLRLNQQPTLADKPEAIAEKKRAEKRAREEAERRRGREMEERRANLGKVQLALGGLGVEPLGARGKGGMGGGGGGMITGKGKQTGNGNGTGARVCREQEVGGGMQVTPKMCVAPYTRLETVVE